MSCFRRFLLVAALLAAALPLPAQLLTFTSRGYLEFTAGTAPAPDFVPGEIIVSFSLQLTRPPEPMDPDATLAVYRPEAARLFVAGQEFALARAELHIVRLSEGPLAPVSGYLLTGATTTGWTFALDHSSPSLEFAPSFSLPRALPTELDWSHAVTLDGGEARWTAYGDAVIDSVRITPVPEPALLGWLTSALLLGCWGRRQWWRRRAATTHVALSAPLPEIHGGTSQEKPQRA